MLVFSLYALIAILLEKHLLSSIGLFPKVPTLTHILLEVRI